MRILQVSTFDYGGGAEKVAWGLFEEYRRLGHDSYCAVGYKRSKDPFVVEIPTNSLKRTWFRLNRKVLRKINRLPKKTSVAFSVQRILDKLPWPFEGLRYEFGIQRFDFSGSRRLLDLISPQPDIIHCHNLHGPEIPDNGYFDLRQLSVLSRECPVVLTLHDAWLLSGHCAHSFECERWKAGCGNCPDLTIYPAVRRDSTAFNWQRKKAIFAQSRLFIATPCNWLMQKVEQSILAQSIVEKRVIPYGIDLSIFRPVDKSAVRAILDLPIEAHVLVFAANSVRQNMWKDYQTMRAALLHITDRIGNQPLLFIALGENGPSEYIGHAEIRFIPFQKDPASVASYYQAADIYFHAAKADTFPNTVLEALACGTPVVATAIGGIPEQVRTLAAEFSTAENATGILVAPRDAQAMAEAAVLLLTNQPLLKQLGENAAKDARQRFSLDRQANAYLEWYQELLA